MWDQGVIWSDLVKSHLAQAGILNTEPLRDCVRGSWPYLASIGSVNSAPSEDRQLKPHPATMQVKEFPPFQ